MKTGTLKELCVKDGDVVECVRDHMSPVSYTVGKRYTVGGPDNCGHQVRTWEGCTIFKIVSRAAKSRKDPLMWKEMTPEQQSAILLAAHNGETLQRFVRGTSGVNYWRNVEKVTDPEFCYRIKSSRVELLWTANFDDVVAGVTESDTFKISFEMVDGEPTDAKVEKV